MKPYPPFRRRITLPTLLRHTPVREKCAPTWRARPWRQLLRWLWERYPHRLYRLWRTPTYEPVLKATERRLRNADIARVANLTRPEQPFAYLAMVPDTLPNPACSLLRVASKSLVLPVRANLPDAEEHAARQAQLDTLILTEDATLMRERFLEYLNTLGWSHDLAERYFRTDFHFLFYRGSTNARRWLLSHYDALLHMPRHADFGCFGDLRIMQALLPYRQNPCYRLMDYWQFRIRHPLQARHGLRPTLRMRRWYYRILQARSRLKRRPRTVKRVPTSPDDSVWAPYNTRRNYFWRGKRSNRAGRSRRPATR